jgi:hypothetical protein
MADDIQWEAPLPEDTIVPAGDRAASRAEGGT